MTTPKRAFEFEMRVVADTKADMAELINHLIEQMDAGSQSCVTGGPTSGGFFKVTENPEMTHERYIEELDKFNEQK